MKVLFLDVDGVLNSRDWFQSMQDRGEDLYDLFSVDPKAVALLMQVLTVTGATLVLSSTWRLVPEAVAHLRSLNLPIADMTPRIDTNNRGREIAAWLKSHPEVTKLAVVDDDSDAGDCGLRKHFVQTSPDHGLLPEHAVKLIRLLGVETKKASVATDIA